ncbi:MAG: hypothetical protein LUM44_12610 [Pyrinomonadaceae bacterium]|nr:hypothetical protein [Pyrinomonadaceae bacterium]
MIDTFQVSRTYARPPNPETLKKHGWKPIFNYGEINAFSFNAGNGKPRLTVSQDNTREHWFIRAEVSAGRWLFGSNLHLVNQSEMNEALRLLSIYTAEHTEMDFDAFSGRVTKVDFTEDFNFGEHLILPIIAKYSRFELPKYERVLYNQSSVYFRNSLKKGKLTKEYKLYGKYQERLDNGNDRSEQEKAKGILRLEVGFRKSAVYRLANELNLEDYTANNILNKKVSEAVLTKAKGKLAFESMTANCLENFELLFKDRSYNDASRLLTFLYLRGQYGNQYAYLEKYGLSHRTCQRFWKECKKIGVIALE